MKRGIMRNHGHPQDSRGSIRMSLKRRVPEILRIVLLAGEVSRIGRAGICRKGERERNLHGRAIRSLRLALEIELIEMADATVSKRRDVRGRALAFEHQHL